MQDGVLFWFKRKLTAGKEVGTNDQQQVSTSKAISQETFNMVKDTLKSMNWDFGLNKQEVKIVVSGSGIPEKMKEKLNEVPM